MIVSIEEALAQGFTGFLVEARSPDSATALGTFTEVPDFAQTISCGTGQVCIRVLITKYLIAKPDVTVTFG